MTQNIQTMRQRLTALRERMASYEGERARKRRYVLILSSVLALLCVIGLTTVTRMVFALDAEAAAEIGRVKLERQLPGGRASLAEYLNRESPRLVREGMITLLDFLPQVRQALVKDLDSKLEMITLHGEEELITQMRESIAALKAQLESEYPDASDNEKFERLVDLVATEFNRKMNTCFDALYPEYVEEVERVHAYLQDLQTRNEEDLAERERLEREMIRTLLRLATREASAG